MGWATGQVFIFLCEQVICLKHMQGQPVGYGGRPGAELAGQRVTKGLRVVWKSARLNPPNPTFVIQTAFSQPHHPPPCMYSQTHQFKFIIFHTTPLQLSNYIFKNRSCKSKMALTRPREVGGLTWGSKSIKAGLYISAKGFNIHRNLNKGA